MSRPARVGVVGLGFIGTAHIETLRRIGVEVAGVVGSEPGRTRDQAAALGATPYESLEALLADPGIGVVHLATPNHLHHAQALAALEAGKHIVCEKPLALSAAETAELVAAADARGLVNAVCFVYRFFPLNHQVRALVGSGDLGSPWLVQGSYHQDWLMRDNDWNWRIDPRRGGALRAVGDIGSHWLDLVEWIIGDRVTRVMADLSTFLPVRRRPDRRVGTFGAASEPGEALIDERVDTEDAAGVLLRFGGGARGTLSLAQVVAGRKNLLAYELAGSRAATAWSSEDAEELWIGHRERANELLLRDPSLLGDDAARLTTYPAGHAEGFADAFAGLFREVYTAIGSGGPPPDPAYPTFRDGHRAVLLGEAVARSAQEERWIDVTETATYQTPTSTGATTP